MPLHPDVVRFLENVPPEARFPENGLTDEAAARKYIEISRAPKPAPADVEEVAHFTEQQISPHVTVRTYTPEGEGPFPVLVYFHGGGWVLGDLDMHDGTCRRLANRGRCAVVNVGYRLAPESTFPDAHVDAEAATRWAVDHASEFKGDPTRLAVAGSSAGGNLAAAMTLVAKDSPDLNIALQVLIYPVLDSRMDTETYRTYAGGHFLTADQMQWFWDQYVPNAEDRVNPSVSPSHAESLAGLPPAIFLSAECDPLRGESEAYAERLRAEGVEVVSERTYPGQIHGFVGLVGVLPDAEIALNQLADDVADFFDHSA